MNESLDVVSIGSAVVDVILRSTHFLPQAVNGELMLCEVYGGKLDVDEAILTSGGAGTNTAVAFTRQGLKAGVIAEVGQDILAQVVIDELEKEGVHTSLLVEEQNEATGVSAILVAADGSRSAITFRGAAKMLTPSDIPFKSLSHIPWIHLSSIGNVDLILQLFLFCKENSIHLSWNPSQGEVQEIIHNSVGDLSNSCEVIFVNEIEYKAVEKRKHILEKMCKTLVVTRGGSGGDIFINGAHQSYTGKQVPVVCELGAGDAFASGFVGALIQKKPLEVAIAQGIENGASVVGYMGAKTGLLTFR